MLQPVEGDYPADVEPIDWKLVTDLPITLRAGNSQTLDLYAMHWEIELRNGGCQVARSTHPVTDRPDAAVQVSVV